VTSDDRRRAIGKVVSVAADRFVVELHRGSDNFTVVGFDDVHYIARLGSFVMIPAHSEYVVAEIVGLRERETAPMRAQSDKGWEIEKSSSAKFLDLVPVGMLPQKRDGPFRFGVSIFPSLYADALYTIDDELDRIFEVAGWIEVVPPPLGDGSSTRYNALTIGRSVVFQGYDVKVRIDEFFGGHSAVLGNTGSGKSCTVATMVQSLFEKKDEYIARGATFFLFDVNGEYRRALAELPSEIKQRYVRLSADPEGARPTPRGPHEDTAIFRLPHWFMSVEEWELLLRASERTQQPVLRTALGLTTLFATTSSIELNKVRNHILASCVQAILLDGDATTPSKVDRIKSVLSTFFTSEINMDAVRSLLKVDFGQLQYAEQLLAKLKPHIVSDATLPGYAHAEFKFDDLGSALELALLYEESHGNRQIRDYCSQMLTRFKWIREREEFSFLRLPPEKLEAHERQVDLYVEKLLGVVRGNGKGQKSCQLLILDLNDGADEVVEVASAVIARLIFDRLRRAMPRNRLPINLVLEEAHRYVAERPSGYAIDASKIFERIAKEGRKYGLFLMVTSQRPSELSKTVLSQCSNFLVHRIQNPDDLLHIRQMTPFVSESVMKRLPSLPKQHALIFGNAVNLPTTFRVRDASPKPMSDDAAIRELWFRREGDPLELEIPK
jgi:uncharacterized protein